MSNSLWRAEAKKEKKRHCPNTYGPLDALAHLLLTSLEQSVILECVFNEQSLSVI